MPNQDFSLSNWATACRFIRVYETGYGQRLRAAGVSNEDRAVLMGHATEYMSEHCATPTVAKLIEMANMVTNTRDATTLLRVVNG